MHRAMILTVCIPFTCLAAQAVQDDWSFGPGMTGPDSTWGSYFDDCDIVSWMAVPGQLCLSSIPLSEAVMHLVDPLVIGAYTADVADLDGDGLNDIAVGGANSPEFAAWFADGQGGWIRRTVSSTADSPAGVDAADIDQDGDQDLLCATYAGGRVLLFLNDGGSPVQWTEVVISADFAGGHDVEVFDIDQDGDSDILAASAEGDRVTWWRNDGGSPIQWHEQDISTTVDYPCRIQACDLNGDGCMDVVASMWLGDRVMAWYGSGGGNPTWTEQLVYYPVHAAHSVRACDVDMDGDPDLIATALDYGTLLLFRNGGGSPVTWTREIIESVEGCGYARTGDVDGDGDPDIMAGSFSSAAGAAWWENDGTGKGWTMHQIAANIGSLSCVLPADVNGNGSLDAVITSRTLNRLYWSELTEFQSEGWLESTILDTRCLPQWSSMDWTVEVPASTSMTVQYRTSTDPSSMGVWSDEQTAPMELSGILQQYFQYRLNLFSWDTESSPLVEQFSLNWDPEGIGEGGEQSTPALSVLGGNPARGLLVLKISGIEGSGGSVSIFDCAGRMIYQGEPEPGDGTTLLQIDPLPAGTYRVLFSDSEGVTATLPVVVLPR